MGKKQTRGVERCEQCAFRARYDANPRSLLGRLWRFHIRFCPGWRRYLNSLPAADREELGDRYRR